MSGTVDTNFANAVHLTLKGDAGQLAEYLRSGEQLGPAERERIAQMAERCAELARGDIGGKVGRPEITGYNVKLLEVIRDYDSRISEGMQKSKAKSEVSEIHGIVCKTVENYLSLYREVIRAHYREFSKRSEDDISSNVINILMMNHGVSEDFVLGAIRENKE